MTYTPLPNPWKNIPHVGPLIDAIQDGLASSSGGGIPATIVDAKGDLIVATADDTVTRQPVGSNDTVLIADSVQSTGIKWSQITDAMVASGANIAQTKILNLTTDLADKISKTIVDAKGDLIVATANDTVTRLPVGTDGQILTADSAQSSGIKWADPAASSSVSAGFIIALG
jgi:hypothetical protein